MHLLKEIERLIVPPKPEPRQNARQHINNGKNTNNASRRKKLKKKEQA
jgi:hypothetical protein